MRMTVTWSAGNGERIPPHALPKRGTTVPLLDADGFQVPATVQSIESTSRSATLELKVRQPKRSRLPGLTP